MVAGTEWYSVRPHEIPGANGGTLPQGRPCHGGHYETQLRHHRVLLMTIYVFELRHFPRGGSHCATLRPLIPALCRLDKSLTPSKEKGWLGGAGGVVLSGKFKTRKILVPLNATRLQKTS